MKKLIAVAAGALVLPAVLAPAASADTVIAKEASGICHTKVSTKYTKSTSIKSGLNVTNLTAANESAAGCSGANKAVRKAVNGGYERPFSVAGWKCTPTVTGHKATFTCTFSKGVTKADLHFGVTYK